MSHPTIYGDSNRFTSLQDSASGHSLCAAPDGPITNPSGQPHAHASLSARQAKGRGLLTSGTYGPPHIGLSASAALSWFLANNLQAKTRMTGSTLYKLTWKVWVMPSGRLHFRLRASVRRTSASVLTGWPTPTANAGKGAGTSGRQGGMNIQTAAQLAGWPTPTATDGRGGVSGWQSPQRETVNGQARCDCTDCRMAYPYDQQRSLTLPPGGSEHVPAEWNQDPETLTGCGSDSRPGPVNGFWRDADWLHCRDGKWRPVKPGLKPLVDGTSGRVGRLRAAGNGLTLQAAIAFIRTVMLAGI